ncbi:hypothetical protein BDW02DRAFT_589862 [Decorospora gaudefroyi]|uniref:Uncharacterized protein n=1 Tax=Decorospora gaudefroyi TaxID=184978 RepID=A0A6A5KDS0_9PLEO|nr:hypothetical protein BDW02DRAFT_589862 [Decorospora gaudefroyi]
MCWFTLAPTKGKKSHHHHRSSSDSSCVEELVRVRRSPSPRFTDVRVKVPSISLEVEEQSHHHHHHHAHPHLHHHHRHPHLHPLHMHPVHGHHLLHPHHHHDMKLRGPGKKRHPQPPCPPPPSREPSRCRPPRDCSPSRPREPIYRTQIIEPSGPAVRETTRAALRSSVQPSRNRHVLRRVAGYEVLGKQVPWDWDCVSSSIASGSNSSGGGWKKGRGGLKYPPFGSMDRWL